MKLDYLVLALLYLFKDGVASPSGAVVIPKLDEVQALLPSICEIHKCAYQASSKRSSAYEALVHSKRQGNVRKRTLTTSSRSVVEALQLVSL
jgi:hypothetical protein